MKGNAVGVIVTWDLAEGDILMLGTSEGLTVGARLSEGSELG
jgi:hypothetical protein